MTNPNEAAFEAEICAWLTQSGGYDEVKDDKVQGEGSDFDRATGLDRIELLRFISATQMPDWEELVERNGGDPNKTQVRFRERIASEVDKRGVVDVLRHGVTDQGVRFRLAYFKPAHGLSTDLMVKYAANRLTVTRQLRYQADSNKSLDVALLLNGIPVATAELKNPLTGQGVEQAMTQYRTDREPKNPVLKRAVVHFAVDPQRVAMTTRLADSATRFLPFNQGNKLGPGNPQVEGAHATSYLWQRVWEREAWLDLLARFVHVEQPAGRGSRKPPMVIFPRFHQWDAVRRLEAAARTEGAGHSYLVQHSAGSGKSNTIAWLAHRLSTLHAGDDKVFDKVIVITDRVVLDRQLQDTIYQFEHTHGVVQRIERDSSQLAGALSGEQARIIITTLQKFPFVMDKVGELPDRSYAVIVDEAHSSQSGDTAKELRRVLGARTSSAAGGEEGELPLEGVDEALAEAVAARGRQQNLSFFAFTATPKGKTLELFGRHNPAIDRHESFHLYSMRQAIGEGFIHDVLAAYTTYDSFWRLEKALEDDPRYQTAKARQAIAKFVNLHEHNLAQKADVVADHFRRRVAGKVAGKAKAMVVCSSREHAVRFYLALRKHISENGYDIGVLAAFSGEIAVNGDPAVTEAGLNGFGDTQTAEKFDTDAFQIMVVAEKFQTGFDQPKLYAMYVDKTLTGLAAVQTLSRLNRTYPDKDGTFVLDFVNKADAIAKEFEQYHGRTVAPPSDPNLLYDTRHALDEFGVLDAEEARTFAHLLLADTVDHGRLHGALGPALDRFAALEDDEQDRFRDALSRFVRIYSFLSQIVTFGDADLERDYLFTKALAAFIKADPGETVDLSSALELTHLRTEKQFEGSVALTAQEGEAVTIYSGTGRSTDPEPESLSVIIERLNAQYGTDWQDADRLVFDAALADMVADKDVQVTAANNTPENFGVVFPEMFQRALLGRMDRNEKVVFKFLDDQNLATDVAKVYATLAQASAKVAYQEHCPIGELLAAGGEGAHLEYKSTLRTSASTGEKVPVLETSVIKSVAAFANSREGGTLLIGVADDGSVHGLDSDYASLSKDGKVDRDVFLLHLNQVLSNALGLAAATEVTTYLHTVEGKDLCRVHTRPSAFPVEANVKV
ncbi:MAG: type I restriction endonuclease, partial [Ornithinimicrobium sp.]